LSCQSWHKTQGAHEMKQLEITEDMVKELRAKVLERLKDDFKKQYNSFNILQRIEEKQGVFFIHLFSTSTKTWSDEFIVYGSKNSILVDTINYTNEFNKENKQKAKEQEEEKALAKEQAKAMIKMLADSNVKTESVDEKVH
jgi:hypothetical protein